ncbi:mCG1047782 [Mus musculus]|nr:mCG1047782 [Mus musculus]
MQTANAGLLRPVWCKPIYELSFVVYIYSVFFLWRTSLQSSVGNISQRTIC